MLPDIQFSPVAVSGCAINLIIAAICYYVRRFRDGRQGLAFFGGAHLINGIVYLLIIPLPPGPQLSAALASPFAYLLALGVVASSACVLAGAWAIDHRLRFQRRFVLAIGIAYLILVGLGLGVGADIAFRGAMILNVCSALVAGVLFLQGRTAFYKLTGATWLLRTVMTLVLALLPPTLAGQQYFITIGILNVIFIAATGFGIILTELDDARQAASDASAAKSQFIANMSHELRTPLNAIIGFAEMVEGRAFAPTLQQSQQYGSLILQAGRHQLGLVDMLLDMASIEAGRDSLVPQSMAADKMAEECVRMLAGEADRAGVVLHTATEPITVMADPRALRQILIALINNAIKFSPAGAAVRVEVSMAGPGRTAIRVCDRGDGISLTELGRIFEPFFQAGDTYTRAKGGLGLGLAIAQRLATALGGSIAVESQPGMGSTFTLLLPRGETLPDGQTAGSHMATIVPDRAN
ncbi:phospho-acceptor domain-containing protein [Dongia mobilis]|uniref:histidine kinase n=1 Tax=Dongia mobilis TaxID=578943 RepID=A0A4R6WRW6_9PROT|nr:HAMP domain-containing sensor histidine kinase [Dongia mobilis]TDQ82221.1 phospho-acceptor domain-containing protein [Dongia mobilis]